MTPSPHLGILVLYEVDSPHGTGILLPPLLLPHVQLNILEWLIHLKGKKNIFHACLSYNGGYYCVRYVLLVGLHSHIMVTVQSEYRVFSKRLFIKSLIF